MSEMKSVKDVINTIQCEHLKYDHDGFLCSQGLIKNRKYINIIHKLLGKDFDKVIDICHLCKVKITREE